jgi:DNA-binding MarR family transcriptional regulator
MHELAERCKCDPSTLTGVVDRLEARGFVERRSSPDDRRVKVLTLTDEGKAMRGQILVVAHDPHPAIAALPAADQRALRDIFRKAFAAPA